MIGSTRSLRVWAYTVPSDLRELWCLAGRGSGKTSFMAVQAVRAACRGYAGVRGLPRILLLAFVREQAGVAFDSGLGEARELLEDTLLYARADASRLGALFDAQIAWAALEKATGGPLQ